MAISRRTMALVAAGAALVLVPAGVAAAAAGSATPRSLSERRLVSVRQPTSTSATTTPIRHLVVIFQENVSFDHCFGTYPNATNTSGQHFNASRDTPRSNNLADTKGLNGKGTLLPNTP